MKCAICEGPRAPSFYTWCPTHGLTRYDKDVAALRAKLEAVEKERAAEAAVDVENHARFHAAVESWEKAERERDEARAQLARALELKEQAEDSASRAIAKAAELDTRLELAQAHEGRLERFKAPSVSTPLLVSGATAELAVEALLSVELERPPASRGLGKVGRALKALRLETGI